MPKLKIKREPIEIGNEVIRKGFPQHIGKVINIVKDVYVRIEWPEGLKFPKWCHIMEIEKYVTS